MLKMGTNGMARLGGGGIKRTHQVEGRGGFKREISNLSLTFILIVLLRQRKRHDWNCWKSSALFPVLGDAGLFAACDGIQLEPPRGVEEAAKAGFEVFWLLIVDEANIRWPPQILANYISILLTALQRNEPNEPNEFGGETVPRTYTFETTRQPRNRYLMKQWVVQTLLHTLKFGWLTSDHSKELVLTIQKSPTSRFGLNGVHFYPYLYASSTFLLSLKQNADGEKSLDFQISVCYSRVLKSPPRHCDRLNCP